MIDLFAPLGQTKGYIAFCDYSFQEAALTRVTVTASLCFLTSSAAASPSDTAVAAPAAAAVRSASSKSAPLSSVPMKAANILSPAPTVFTACSVGWRTW